MHECDGCDHTPSACTVLDAHLAGVRAPEQDSSDRTIVLLACGGVVALALVFAYLRWRIWSLGKVIAKVGLCHSDSSCQPPY